MKYFRVTKANVSILLYPAVIVATPLLEPLSLSGFLEIALLFLFLLHLLIILPQSPLLTALQPLRFAFDCLVMILCTIYRIKYNEDIYIYIYIYIHTHTHIYIYIEREMTFLFLFY